jgi:hypothetical protein
MTFTFEPPLQLVGSPVVFVRSLDDARGVLREYVGRRTVTRDLILRRLSGASTKQAGEVARIFRWWAEQEGLLLRQPQSTLDQRAQT